MRKSCEIGKSGVLIYSSDHLALPVVVIMRFSDFPTKLVMLEGWGAHQPKVLLSAYPSCRGRTHWVVSLFGSKATCKNPPIATHEGPYWVNNHEWSLNPIPLFSGGDMTSISKKLLGLPGPSCMDISLSFSYHSLGSCGHQDTSVPLFPSPPHPGAPLFFGLLWGLSDPWTIFFQSKSGLGNVENQPLESKVYKINISSRLLKMTSSQYASCVLPKAPSHILTDVGYVCRREWRWRNRLVLPGKPPPMSGCLGTTMRYMSSCFLRPWTAHTSWKLAFLCGMVQKWQQASKQFFIQGGNCSWRKEPWVRSAPKLGWVWSFRANQHMGLWTEKATLQKLRPTGQCMTLC